MALRREPTARQLRLAAELRRLRDAAGLTAREAATLLGVSPVQISHIESGLAGVSESRLRSLAAHYACTDRQLVEALVAMATDRTRGWWEEFRGLLPTPFLDLAELEHHATFLREAQFLYVPGPLQTEDYARAVYAYRVPELPEHEVELRVRHRMRRKVILERPTPTPYEAVVHEAALRIMVSDRATSRAQLARVLELSEAEHVTVPGRAVRSGGLRRCRQRHDLRGRRSAQTGYRRKGRPARRGIHRLGSPARRLSNALS
ncbi:hypothetical protein GCM10010512_16890 [Streptomyces thermoviolaceus subsp. thermoviolaceus]|nr:hypothetical protein GCM10010512_16890 [Streptomyces thermoviolaceus subsp. thermoviolaceus]